MASMPPIYDRVMSRRYDQSCPSLERNQPVPVAVCRQGNPFIPAGLRVHAATLFAESEALSAPLPGISWDKVQLLRSHPDGCNFPDRYRPLSVATRCQADSICTSTACVLRADSWNYAAIFQQATWDRGPQLPSCVIRRMCAIAHSTRERMSISDRRVRWTGHFSAISSSFERCSWVSRPVNSRSLSMRSSIPSLLSQSAQSAA